VISSNIKSYERERQESKEKVLCLRIQPFLTLFAYFGLSASEVPLTRCLCDFLICLVGVRVDAAAFVAGFAV
jgi:hypothetical protein